MKVLVAGATGAIGARLVPLLAGRGHDVVGMIRSRATERQLREAGAEPIVADGLDRTAVVEAVSRAEPEVVVHEMTSLARMASPRHWDDGFATTNRLRTEGTDNLVEAARLAGVRRLVVQSFGNWNYERTGSPVKSETDPLDPSPPASMRRSLTAIEHLESVAQAAGGLALRYGNLYGPGTDWAPGGTFYELVRKRRLPLIGDGAGIWSFVHVDDAALATVAAVERGAAGVYNVCDDEPARVDVWLPVVARLLGAKPPPRVPAWLGRLTAGEAGLSLFTQVRGASNTKAKRELGWRLLYPSWRQGFEHGLDDVPVDPTATRLLDAA